MWISLALIYQGRSERCQATVYQKHSSMQNRKVTYMGRRLPSARRSRGEVHASYLSPGERRP